MNSQATNNDNNNRSPKRTRFADDNGSQQQKQQPTTKSPTKAATEALERAVASLPLSLQQLVRHFGTQVIDLRAKLANKQQLAKRMEEDAAYIPKSAKATNFSISFSRLAQENTTQEDKDFLDTQIQQAKQQYEGALKAIIETCLQHEIKALWQSEKVLMSDLLHGLASAANTENSVDHQHTDTTVTNILDCNKDDLFQFSSFTAAQIKDNYRVHHGIETMPNATIMTRSATHNPTNRVSQASLAEEAQIIASYQKPENKGYNTLTRCLKAVLVVPTTAANNQKLINDRIVNMKKLVTELMDGKATETAAMETEAEQSASRELLIDLIRKESDKRDRKYDQLSKQFAELQKQMQQQQQQQQKQPKQPKQQKQQQQQSKGAQRGRTQGASARKTNRSNSNNRNNRRQSRSKSRNRGNRNQAAGRNDDTNDDNAKGSNNNNNNNSNKQSKGKKQRSTTNNSKQYN